MSKKKSAIRWLNEPAKHDRQAADRYLTLLFDESAVARYARKLRRADVVKFEAKDLLRASNLPPLGASNSHVKKELQRIKEGTPLSPLLLVRDSGLGRLTIADGYHRVCAVYSIDQDATIPCCIV